MNMNEVNNEKEIKNSKALISEKKRVINKIYEFIKSKNIDSAEEFNELEKRWSELESIDVSSFKDKYLEEKLDYLQIQYDEAIRKYNKMLSYEKNIKEGIEKKTALVLRAEELCDSEDYKETTIEFKKLFEQWKETPYSGKSNNDLWKRFKTANDKFFERRNSYYDKTQKEAKTIKLDLIEKAKELRDSTDWKHTSAIQKELMDAWKKAGSAGRNVDNKLWDEFLEYRNEFYSKQKVYYDVVNQKRQEEEEKKREIIKRAKEVSKNMDKKTIEMIKELQAEWKETGFAGKELEEELYAEFRGICDDVFKKSKEAYENRKKNFKKNLEQSIERRWTSINKIMVNISKLKADIDEIESKPEPRDTNPNKEEILRKREARIHVLKGYIAENEAKIDSLKSDIEDIEHRLEK